MECRQFQEQLSEVACGALIEASAREAVLAHVAVCSACAARLAMENELTTSFGEIVRSDAVVAAPARVKSALLAAYREGDRPPIARISPDSTRQGRRFLLLAASVLLLAVPVGYAFWPSQQRVVESTVPATLNVQNIDPGPSAPVVLQPTVTTTPRVRSQSKRVTRSATRSAATPTETMTDYIPLTYLDDATAMEGSQIVRIDVPRSSLAAFGLLVGQDRLDERVKADIIIGDDGLARAIRFVQ